METTTILHLPTEILVQILVLADLSQRQLLELASVSARFNTVAISIFLSSFAIHDPKGTCTVSLGFVHDDLKLDALSGLLMSVDIKSIETLICILPKQGWGRDEIMIQLLRLNSFLYQLSYLKKLVLRFYDDPTYADIRAINDFAQLFGIIITTITSKGCGELIVRNYATEKTLKNGSRPPSETNLYNPSQLSSSGGRRDQGHSKSTSGGRFGSWMSSLFKKKPHVTHANMQHEIQPWVIPYDTLHIQNSIRTLRIEASTLLFDPCFVHTAQLLPDIVSFGLENISLSLSDFSGRLLALKIAFCEKDGDGPSLCFIPHNIPSDFLSTPLLRTNNILEHLSIRRCEKTSATILLPFIVLWVTH
ncbi:hypothetical protein BDQ12DRAFT_691780 [Crucibulum laeve]|uniref:F-box domain-containing protein n=1 Tax=Crucibulum laeve TaxID=68775 RepID=A0A5C3LL26_9AGAR|nr:hypothetical protein BDQ12DRAFT_691780 [Crucibulum laeve]